MGDIIRETYERNGVETMVVSETHRTSIRL